VFDSPEFIHILRENLGTELTEDQIQRIASFREEVLKENAVQNLTRLLSPTEFYEGHVLDVVHLERSGLLEFPALDLGAGMGVPGLLHALIYSGGNRSWISCDSEGKKADFSKRMAEQFNLCGVSIFSSRGEEVLINQSVSTVVARALGPVSRIYGWLRTRSTWNKLLLLKGPKWEEEWNEFERSPHQGRLFIEKKYEYRVGGERKQLKMIRLGRT
jgi:16S rRNA G527 N7-methylase RsmG